MSGFLFLFILLILCLCYALFLYITELPNSENFSTRDVPVGGYTDPPLSTGQRASVPYGLQQLNHKSASRSDDFGPFPGQDVTRPDKIAPSTRQGILSDFSISLSKPYDDFVSPEPHHLETIWPESLDRTCNKLNRTDCVSSQYCILVNGETNGETCRGAFPNTADARMYNNYATKLLPQSDLSYYYRDGICYGECSGWNPSYANPDPIHLSNINNNPSDVNSSAGILTTDNMYGKITIPLVTNMPTKTPSTTKSPSTYTNEFLPSDLLPNEYINIDTVTNIINESSNIIITDGTSVTTGPLVCTPECAHNYSCENNLFNQAVCMPNKRLYGAQPKK